jgi:beta-phosphoglucomutase-like phosphatase (HAD superfamily)
VADHPTSGPVALPAGVRACLFDLDGVLTGTAVAHEAARRQMFDAFLAGRGDGSSHPFGLDDYEQYVDGKPRDDGVRSFLASRGIEVPEGSLADPAGAPTVARLGRRKNDLFLSLIAADGVEVFDGSVLARVPLRPRR